MYNAIRKIHLYSGLVIMIFLMMYFVSGYIMIHRNWFGGETNKPAAQERSESLAGFSADRTPEALAEYVVERFDLNGQVRIPPPQRQPKDAIRFTVFRPGTTHEVTVPHNSDTLTIRTNRENLSGVFNQLHRIHGYRGGWLFNTYVLFSDLASFSCILFALSGVYLWWKTAQRKIWGILCLGISCSYGIAIVLYLMCAR